MFTLFFCGSAITDYKSAKAADSKRYAKFFHGLLEEGVYFPPAQWEAAFLSYSHEKKELDRTLTAVRRALQAALVLCDRRRGPRQFGVFKVVDPAGQLNIEMVDAPVAIAVAEAFGQFFAELDPAHGFRGPLKHGVLAGFVDVGPGPGMTVTFFPPLVIA